MENAGCVISACSQNTEDLTCVLDAGAAQSHDLAVVLDSLGACCNGACTNLHGDRANCGNCGLTCAPDQVCSNGACVAPGACTSETNGDPCAIDGGTAAGVCCLGACVDLSSDPSNCGACAWQCPGLDECLAGTCDGPGGSCPAGTSLYESPYWSTLNPGCLPATCGPVSAGTDCFIPDAGASAQMACCGSRCTDITSDPANCGGCGKDCGPDATCFNNGGFCVYITDCTSPASNYDAELGSCLEPDGGVGSCCNGTCSSIYADNANCAACGTACPSGTFCSDYFCNGEPDGGGLFNVTCEDAGCPGGMVCASTTVDHSGCLRSECSPIELGSWCAFDAGAEFGAQGGTCCGTNCVSLGDPGSCGACGISCPTGTRCGPNDVCDVSCDPVTAPCPSGAFCGALFPGSGPICARASCDPSTEGQVCAFGYLPPGEMGFSFSAYDEPSPICCGDQCVDLDQDPNNCGLCGDVCPSGICQERTCFDPTPSTSCLQTCVPLTVCSGGQCVDSLCLDSPGASCAAEDGNVGYCCGNAVCADLADDARNCGQCGVVCPSGQTCSGGYCGGSTECGPGHIGEWCNKDAGAFFVCCPGLGCIDTSSDPTNCAGAQSQR